MQRPCLAPFRWPIGRSVAGVEGPRKPHPPPPPGNGIEGWGRRLEVKRAAGRTRRGGGGSLCGGYVGGGGGLSEGEIVEGEIVEGEFRRPCKPQSGHCLTHTLHCQSPQTSRLATSVRDGIIPRSYPLPPRGDGQSIPKASHTPYTGALVQASLCCDVVRPHSPPPPPPKSSGVSIQRTHLRDGASRRP